MKKLMSVITAASAVSVLGSCAFAGSYQLVAGSEHYGKVSASCPTITVKSPATGPLSDSRQNQDPKPTDSGLLPFRSYDSIATFEWLPSYPTEPPANYSVSHTYTLKVDASATRDKNTAQAGVRAILIDGTQYYTGTSTNGMNYDDPPVHIDTLITPVKAYYSGKLGQFSEKGSIGVKTSVAAYAIATTGATATALSSASEQTLRIELITGP